MAELPSNESMLQNLVEHGDPFMDQREPVPLDGMTYYHPGKERSLNIAVDARALSACGIVYANGDRLVGALKKQGANRVLSYRRARELFFERTAPNRDGLLISFAGFTLADPALEYSQEARGIEKIYEHLEERGRLPALAINGAARKGVLGLSSVIAHMHNVETVGIAPLQGLKDCFAQSHLLVWGRTYVERQVMVATWGDAIIATGGGQGTLSEVEFAAQNKSAVMLFSPKEYGHAALTKTYMHSPDLAQAATEKRLVVCESIDAIPDKIDELIAITNNTRGISRDKRRAQMKNFTLSPPSYTF